MRTCVIRITDEVNAKLVGLEVTTRNRLAKELKFFMPYAFHVPAYKLGRWDGCVSFFSLGGATFVNLLERILPVLYEEHYEVSVEDQREQHDLDFVPIDEEYHGDMVWPDKHPMAGQLVRLRDYQVDAVNHFLTTPQSIQEIATGAGKTLMTATMSKCIEHIGRSLVIVPNKDLVRQTYEDYHNLGLDVGVYFGDEKQTDKTHTIATWQSLNVLDKRFKDGETNISLDVFSTGLAAIIVDEVHQAKADVLKKLLTGPFANVPIRWGLTGTVPKEDWQKISLEVSLGPVVSSLSAATLQDMGVLAECHVNVVQMEETAEYGSYQEELEYLTTNSSRLDYIADLVKNISDTGNTLVLVDRILAGEQIVKRIEDSVFVSGSMKSKDRKDEYDEVATSTGKVIVATYGVASVGINIPRIFNLVLLEPGKSFVRVIQSIGRGIRKAQDKDFVQIWDLTSTSKFSKRHLRERKKFYADAKYPYLIEKVDYRSPKKGKK